MKVKELIEALKNMDQEADVRHLWDGEPRTDIEHVYMGKTGFCITSDGFEVAYSNDGRPIQAPDESTDPYWRAPTQR